MLNNLQYVKYIPLFKQLMKHQLTLNDIRYHVTRKDLEDLNLM